MLKLTEPKCQHETKHISTTLALVDLGACSLLGWITLKTSFLESPRSLKTEFGVESYGVFCEVTVDVGSDPNHTPTGLWRPGLLWTKERSMVSLFCGEEWRGLQANRQRITNVLT